MNAAKLTLTGPSEMAAGLAKRVKALRLLRGWTQVTLAQRADVSRREATVIIDEVQAAVSRWHDHAARAGVSKATARQIAQALRRDI
ncbi:MAG TPA: helix-turn-helix transcriptional regulator [Phycisphaerae bacterium]|jgi:transcriptional regulator with XRE-family HTH domain|nr:helix-turn-helix transcriptional regulator [Phycisphaerae bacterium]HOB76245.1 helix-turn-helix transcriptional regulator [Phycisphaerae bacterium]HOJ56263.1 helix-turn-helix transcriptional regulator [Phycisphaerae bacterium]HOL27865.1 helix-turn-helix transcriptional regulator [Phycisphaerae bacterium]HPP19653.1 helix-turn-helix transcriptional regulator [Phycisphaerae bacterium]